MSIHIIFWLFKHAFCCKIWEKTANVKVIAAAKNDRDTFAQKAENITKEAPSVQNVGFIGLGAMGFGMASTLLREKFTVCGFDVRRMIKWLIFLYMNYNSYEMILQRVICLWKGNFFSFWFITNKQPLISFKVILLHASRIMSSFQAWGLRHVFLAFHLSILTWK